MLSIVLFIAIVGITDPIIPPRIELVIIHPRYNLKAVPVDTKICWYFSIDNVEITELDERAMYYELYFGLNSNPPLYAIIDLENAKKDSKCLDIYGLEYGKRYYCRIIAKYKDETIEETPVFSFITISLGEIKWKFQTEGPIHSSPAIGKDGTIYFCSDDGFLYALKSDGSFKWKYEKVGPLVIVSDETIYIANDGLYAINNDGTLEWTYKSEGNNYTQPVIGQDGTIYVAVSDKLIAFNKNGNLKWKYEAEEDGTQIYTSPAIGNDGTIYIVTHKTYETKPYVYSINPDGTLKWKFEIEDDVMFSPVISEDGAIYMLTKNNELHAIKPNGKALWKYEANHPLNTKPIVGKNGIIYVADYGKSIYVINPDGSLKLAYETEFKWGTHPVMCEDGTIIIGSTDGYLYAIQGVN